MERGELEAAYVLHRRAYRDTSALVELFTVDHGRVGVVARGIRTPKARQAALIQPFQPLRVSWRARGDLGTLTDVEAASAALALVGRRMVAGFYANELLLRVLVRNQPQPLTFTRYAGLIGDLARGASIGPSLRVFERDLLAELGYGLALSIDRDGRALVGEQWYRYDLEHGPCPVDSGNGDGLRLRGEALLALAHGAPGEKHDSGLKRLTRAALRPHLGQRPLKSRELYARYRDDGPSDSEEITNE